MQPHKPVKMTLASTISAEHWRRGGRTSEETGDGKLASVAKEKIELLERQKAEREVQLPQDKDLRKDLMVVYEKKLRLSIPEQIRNLFNVDPIWRYAAKMDTRATPHNGRHAVIVFHQPKLLAPDNANQMIPGCQIRTDFKPTTWSNKRTSRLPCRD